LARNLDVIKFAVLELSEIVAKEVERLDAWSGVEIFFLPVPPLLKLPDILIMCEFTLDEIFLVFSLPYGVSFFLSFKQQKHTLADPDKFAAIFAMFCTVCCWSCPSSSVVFVRIT